MKLKKPAGLSSSLAKIISLTVGQELIKFELNNKDIVVYFEDKYIGIRTVITYF